MIEFSNATTADIPALVELWNAALGADFPMTERPLKQTVEADPFYEQAGNFVARDGEKIIGWALCKSMKAAGPEWGRFQNRGGIGALCVHPAYQRRGIATQLLERAEEYLCANGSPITTLYFPHHLLPGIPAQCHAAIELFRKRGYSGFHKCVDLWRDLKDYTLPDKVLRTLEANPTVEIRPAHAVEAAKVIAMVAREFPGGWTYSTKNHFARGGNPADIIIAIEDNQVIGFCHTADWNSNWLLPNTYWHLLLGEKYGGLGPVGMATAHRKRGLGLALTAVAVDDLKRRGVQRMAIDWTTLISFYEQLGFTVWKEYLQAEKA